MLDNESKLFAKLRSHFANEPRHFEFLFGCIIKLFRYKAISRQLKFLLFYSSGFLVSGYFLQRDLAKHFSISAVSFFFVIKFFFAFRVVRVRTILDKADLFSITIKQLMFRVFITSLFLHFFLDMRLANVKTPVIFMR